MSITNTAELAALLAQLAQTLVEGMPEPSSPVEARPMTERVLLKVEEAAERLGIGRTTAYALVRSGELESVRIGNLRRVSVTAINEFAARLTSKQRAA